MGVDQMKLGQGGIMKLNIYQSMRHLLVVFVLCLTGQANAAEQAIEEIIVTARQQAEGLQDVPVTITALTEADLERYNVRDLREAAKLVPNMQIVHGASGNGSNLYIRGVGSSSISAAFDQSVSINLDGVISSRGRLIHSSYLDMKQIEVLKGPQSLYFGKSATAGVVSITTNDPGDELEFTAMAGVDPEFDGQYGEAIISGPISDTFGARFAIGVRERDELYENIHSGASIRWRGEESLNSRLTLLWEPTESFSARFKYTQSTFENDGPGGNTEELCPEGTVQPTTVLQNGQIIPGEDDCKLNGNTSSSDLLSPLYEGNPLANGGVPYLEQDLDILGLQLVWGIGENFQLTSMSSTVHIDHQDFEIFDYNAGVFGGGHANDYEDFSQEFRLASDFDGSFNFLFGLFYQDIEQEFLAHQYAANIGLVGIDPTTKNGYDYNKNHFLDTKVKSAYLATYWDLTDQLELTVGVRYTNEEKDGYITIPYVHAFLRGTFGAPALIPDINFDDTNTSPELALNYHLSDDVSVFFAYKEAFKSGGIDNSALPTASLDPATNPDFPGFLLYDSEEAKGFEVGMKARFLDGAMRFNATAYSYDYEDLQTQVFNSVAIQFTTTNASGLQTRGVEFDMLWVTPVDGLTLHSAWGWNNAEYDGEFLNADGEDLDGENRERNAEIAGNFGINYDWVIGGGWRMALSADTRYSGDYTLAAVLDSYEQGSYWLFDTALRLYSEDERYELSLIGRNLNDEIVAYSSGARPGACAMADRDNADAALRCDGTALGIEQDQVVSTGLGREVFLQFRVRF